LSPFIDTGPGTDSASLDDKITESVRSSFFCWSLYPYSYQMATKCAKFYEFTGCTFV